MELGPIFAAVVADHAVGVHAAGVHSVAVHDAVVRSVAVHAVDAANQQAPHLALFH